MRMFWIAKETLEATVELIKELLQLQQPEAYSNLS